jgi:predicted small metal-binding protein
MEREMINLKKGEISARVFLVAWGKRRNTMEKLLRCRDFGLDCDFEACGETPEEVLRTAADHARAVHGLKKITKKDRLRAVAAIQDAFCVPKGGYNPGGGVFY